MTPTRSMLVPESVTVTVTGSEKAWPPIASFAIFTLNCTTRGSLDDVLDSLNVALVWTAVCGAACLHLMFFPDAESVQTAAAPPGTGVDWSSWIPSTTRAAICGGLKVSVASRMK